MLAQSSPAGKEWPLDRWRQSATLKVTSLDKCATVAKSTLHNLALYIRDSWTPRLRQVEAVSNPESFSAGAQLLLGVHCSPASSLRGQDTKIGGRYGS